MSTRCHIAFYNEAPETEGFDNFEALVYRHCDGYPDDVGGVLATVLPVLRDLCVVGYDPEFTAAEFVGEMLARFKAGSNGRAYIGVSREIHSDIAYFYAVYPEEFAVYGVRFFGEGASPRFTRLSVHPLAEQPPEPEPKTEAEVLRAALACAVHDLENTPGEYRELPVIRQNLKEYRAALSAKVRT